ncbi:MAG: indolepyruvate oxidoreductase subunit beta [Candidatus Atabeyarchaeum deiterrae]
MEQYNTLIVGIGGQGVLTTAEVLARAGIVQGYKVLMAEIHGMAQRGGRVPCSVRFGDSISSATIPEGAADLVISLEFAEALTSVPFASRKTVFVLSKQVNLPPMITIGLGRYPTADEVIRAIKQTSCKIYVIDAPDMAKKAGSLLTTNSVMLGAGIAAGEVPIKDESIKEAMKSTLPQRSLETNIRAYEMGRTEVFKIK